MSLRKYRNARRKEARAFILSELRSAGYEIPLSQEPNNSLLAAIAAGEWDMYDEISPLDIKQDKDAIVRVVEARGHG